jgi:hypothetical protein
MAKQAVNRSEIEKEFIEYAKKSGLTFSAVAIKIMVDFTVQKLEAKAAVN